jgi:hypothetical protein
MKVLAKCIADVWDSTNCFMFKKGLTYEIDSEEPVASIMTVPWDPNPVDENGDPCVPLPKPPYAFQFDRSLTKGLR